MAGRCRRPGCSRCHLAGGQDVQGAAQGRVGSDGPGHVIGGRGGTGGGGGGAQGDAGGGPAGAEGEGARAPGAAWVASCAPTYCSAERSTAPSNGWVWALT